MRLVELFNLSTNKAGRFTLVFVVDAFLGYNNFLGGIAYNFRMVSDGCVVLVLKLNG